MLFRSLYTSTKTRVNEKWLLKDEQLKQILNNFSPDEKILNFVDNFSFVGPHPLLYQSCFLQVVSETVYHYPVPYISEKTVKPIANKRPFVIVGAAGSLTNLHRLGFKTFSNFWSEDYDTILDPEKRIKEVFKVIELICNKSINDLQTLCVEMSDVLTYNFNYYIDNFKKTQLQQFEQACIKNLQPRYD